MPRADLHDLDRTCVGFVEPVDADDDAIARLDPALQSVRTVGDSTLCPARLDAGHRTAKLVDLGHDRERSFLDSVGQVSSVAGAPERVGHVRDARRAPATLRAAHSELDG